jgi:hypothetical protein
MEDRGGGVVKGYSGRRYAIRKADSGKRRGGSGVIPKYIWDADRCSRWCSGGGCTK